MSKSLEHYSEWLEHDGKVVYIDQLAYNIKVRTYTARYPYEQQMITVDAEPKNKQSKYYREIKQHLGDDWSTDVLDSDPDVYANVLLQCRNQAFD